MYVKEFFFTTIFIFMSNLRWSIYVGLDGLCTYFGFFLKFLRRIDKVIYWSIDFVPEARFKSSFKNKFYKYINTHGYINADELWDLSPKMAESRKKYWGIGETDVNKHKVVPYGLWTERIKKYDYENCEKNTLVFMGHVLEKQGVQLVIDAIPLIIKKIPDFKFKIIGSGKYLDNVIEKAKERKVDKYCDFVGVIEDPKEMETEIAKSCIAVAPYVSELDKWTKYADPGKIKTYLACGVPVLLTDVPWNAKEIEKIECGKIIAEDPENIAQSVIMLMSKDVNQKFRNNAIEYSKGFDYNNIFNSLL
jgi:glycosyltransferase involved in cell wall biosynthesis